MKPNTFTDARVRQLKCHPGRDYTLHWDTKQTGLGVRVTAAGVRSYIFESRVNRRSFRVTIGRVGDPWSVAGARVEARKLATHVDQRIDPRVVAEQEGAQAEAARVEARRRDLFLEGVWGAYIDANADNPAWGDRHRKNHEALARAGGERKKKRGGKGLTKPGPLAALMPLKLADLTSEQVAAWLTRETRTRPTSAAQAFRALRAFVNWTHETDPYRGVVPADACSAGIVRKRVPKSKTKEGDCLQREHLPTWFREVRKISNPVIRVYLQGLLLLGPRREELAALRWTDVDFKWGGSLTIRDKVEGTRVIPLPPYMASLLSTLRRRNEWVFDSAESESGRLVEPTKAHRLALKRGGLDPVSLHGLRRSFGTLAEWVEMPTGVVAQIQGHKPSATAEKHYRRRPIDLLRMWHEKLEAWMLDQAGVAFVRPAEPGKLSVVK